MKKILVSDDEVPHTQKDILIHSDPQFLRPLLNPLGWRILSLLREKAMYPVEIARILKLYDQTVYTIIRQLRRSGLVVVESEERIRGAVAKCYRTPYSAFGVELRGGEQPSMMKRPIPDERITRFFRDFINEGVFDGKIVVGSPEPHGPNRTTARDGHYAIQLGFLLGQLCTFSHDFVVKLDVDVKTEKEEKHNLVLIGGPGTNLITADVNQYLPIRFNSENYWAGLSDAKGRSYTADTHGLIAKIKNPFDKSSNIIVLAGVRHVGTKSAIIAISNFPKLVLSNFKGEETWAVAVRGFDLDGDGKVDSVERIS